MCFLSIILLRGTDLQVAALYALKEALRPRWTAHKPTYKYSVLSVRAVLIV